VTSASEPGGFPTRLLWAAAVGVAVGVVLVALPDNDRRVLSLSETHGPSTLDLVGSILLTASWLPVPVLAWRWRRRVPARVWGLVAGLAVVGAVALYATISRDLGWWWLPSAAVLAGAQLTPLLHVALAGHERAPAGAG
jgi:hypothetical protein